MRRIDYIVFHCTAGPQWQKVEDILAYWKGVLGWKTPGYHYIIRADGTYANLVPIEKPSNGVKGYNAHAIHIAYIGGVVTDKNDPVNALGSPIDNRTEAQKKTMIILLDKFSKMFPAAIVQGHRDFSPDKNRDGVITPDEWMKSCPSFSVAAWLREIEFKSKLPKSLFTTTGVNIRTGPGIRFPKAAPALSEGVVVRFLGEVEDWSYVSVEGDIVKGYVKREYLRA